MLSAAGEVPLDEREGADAVVPVHHRHGMPQLLAKFGFIGSPGFVRQIASSLIEFAAARPCFDARLLAAAGQHPVASDLDNLDVLA